MDGEEEADADVIGDGVVIDSDTDDGNGEANDDDDDDEEDDDDDDDEDDDDDDDGWYLAARPASMRDESSISRFFCFAWTASSAAVLGVLFAGLLPVPPVLLLVTLVPAERPLELNDVLPEVLNLSAVATGSENCQRDEEAE